MRKLTTNEFIEKARVVHGDQYNYSKVNYINNSTKVCIICPVHGEFWQTPSNHLGGRGCVFCKKEWIGNYRRKDANTFIEQAKKVHGDKYDYSKVEYINEKTKVCIICPEHGEFWQKPEVHLMGCGCQKCCKTGVKLNREKFIEKARAIHGDKYDYSKVIYKNAKTKVCIICKERDEFGVEHGEFWQTPDSHLRGGECPKCKHKVLTRDYFISKSNLVHNGKYDYSQVDFVDSTTKVKIICPEHGEFWQSPSKHMSGQGCPLCLKFKLEEQMIQILNKYEIEYQRQKKFDWLKFKQQQSLDFFLPKYNIAIECQGKQHFISKNTHADRGGDTLETIQERDTVKKELCEKNGIKVLYFSNLKIQYPYPVITKEEELIKTLLNT